MSSSQFVQSRIGDEHLPQSIPTIGLSPGLFHGLDVFGFCDQRTKPIWGTKRMNQLKVVDHRMLMWWIETLYSDAALFKDILVPMKAFKGSFECFKTVRVVDILSCDVAKVNKGLHGQYHLIWDMTLNGG